MTNEEIKDKLNYAGILFDSYQVLSSETVLPSVDGRAEYFYAGLASEAGEVNDLFKKAIRDNDGNFNAEYISKLSKELGDVLWYITQLASHHNLNLGDIAESNIKKLLDRKTRDVLTGSGDDR